MEPEIEVSTEANIRLVTSIDKFGKQITRKVRKIVAYNLFININTHCQSHFLLGQCGEGD